MATAEDALFAILTTGSPNAVASLIGNRAYWGVLKQNTAYPALRLQRISTPRSQYRTLDGHANYASPRFQIDCYALAPSGAWTLAQACYAMLEGFTATVAGLRIDVISTEDERASVETDIGPNGAAVYVQSIDIFLAHPE